MMAETVLANLGIAQATIATLATVMLIGLGFLQRPSRATLLWSFAFVLAMVSTWASVAGDVLGVEDLRRLGLGVLLGTPALIWSGFRARRGATALSWVAAVQTVASAAALLLVRDPAAYNLTFRIAFLGTAVMAGLILREIRRSPDRHDRMVIPLAFASGAFVVLGTFTLVSGLIAPFGPAAGASDLTFVRGVNLLGMLIYLVCATVTLLFLSSVSPVGAQSAMAWPQFVVVAGDRLRRARERGETSWAVLTARIDDPDDVRVAAGDSPYARIAERFEQTVRACFPAEADIGREARGRVVVLVSRPGAVLREHVRTLLREVTETDGTAQIAVQLSASVGWASADVVGYDLDALLAASARACDEASAAGGDRWVRVGA